MAINFPPTPDVGDQITSSASGITWEWNGTVWKSLGTEVVGPTGPQGETGPTGPTGSAGAPYGNIDGGSPTSVYGGTMTLDGGGVVI